MNIYKITIEGLSKTLTLISSIYSNYDYNVTPNYLLAKNFIFGTVVSYKYVSLCLEYDHWLFRRFF